MKKRLSQDWMILLPAALVAVVVHILAINGFGIFRDELYYLACADHPAFGYVDQPPLSIWLLSLIRMVLGDSVVAIRLLPVLASGVWVYMTGRIAREFGGGRFAMLLASFAALAPLGNLVIFNYYSMNFLDMVFWQVLFLILIRLIKTQDTHYWIWFGLTAGLASLNKISVLFLGFGLVAGLLLTKNRIHLKSGHFWMGMGLASVIFLPYIVWNTSHDWATLTFIHNAKTYKMADVSPVGFFMGQILYNNPVNVLIWLPGLFFLLFHSAVKKMRLFGWMFLAIYILFTIRGAKDYYLAAAYPILFAGGAVLWEQWLNRKTGLVLKPVLLMLLVTSTLMLTPLVLPILPVDQTIETIQKIGIEGQSGEKHDMGVLPQHFADMHGWSELATAFADVYQQLNTEEQDGCLIYVRNYGQAGAIDYFGSAYGLPKAACAHNNYWLWGPPEWDGRVAIIYGWSHDVEANLNDLNRRFESVQHAATFTHPYCMPYENNRPIFICRGALFSFETIWAGEKNYN